MSTSHIHVVKHLLAIYINVCYSINPHFMDNQSALIWLRCSLIRLGMHTCTNQLSFKRHTRNQTALAVPIVFSVEIRRIKKLLLCWNLKILTIFFCFLQHLLIYLCNCPNICVANKLVRKFALRSIFIKPKSMSFLFEFTLKPRNSYFTQQQYEGFFWHAHWFKKFSKN